MKLATPPGGYVFQRIKFILTNFVECCPVIISTKILVSEIFKVLVLSSVTPLAAMFFDIKFISAIFVESHLLTISVKLFSILTTGFRDV